MQAVFETIFDILYLAAVLFLGVRMIRESRGRRQYFLYGVMAVMLGLGDAFHLLPRSAALCTTGLSDYTAALGIGKLITSITMTFFYLLLYYVWRERYRITGRKTLSISVWALAVSRIFLCLLPQNEWLSETPPLSFGIYRNIPFVLLGLLIILLYYKAAKQYKDSAFRRLWLTIVLSFAFYIPVVLFSDVFPPVGMLMIPKTAAYVWAVLIGYHAMKGEALK